MIHSFLPLLHTPTVISLPLHLYHFPESYFVSKLPLPAGRADTTWELSKP